MTAQWHPIDTAPKDGTDVLLYLPKADPPVRVGRYVAKGVIRSDYWFFYTGAIRSSREWEIAPSHWMPLPEPPK